MTEAVLNYRQTLDLKKIMATDPKLSEEEARARVSGPTTEEILADSPYTRIRIQETSQDKDARWGPLFVGINDYSVRIPRGTEVIVANPLLDQIFRASQRRTEILVQTLRNYTADQAHAERLQGSIPVYPAKVTPSSILFAASAADTKPKGSK